MHFLAILQLIVRNTKASCVAATDDPERCELQKARQQQRISYKAFVHQSGGYCQSRGELNLPKDHDVSRS